MAKRTGNSSVNSSIRQQTKANDEGLSNLLSVQQAALGELSSIRQLTALSKEKEKNDKAAVAGVSSNRIQVEMLNIAKETMKGNRRYWKTQDEFQTEWNNEAKNIAELAKSMKMFKTMGERFNDKVEGVKEKYGIANGGLKQTVLTSMNPFGIFDKTLERDEFIKKQKALGSKKTNKQLKEDYEGARKATHAITKNENALGKLKALTNISDEETLRVYSPAAQDLFAKRQTHTETLAKYDLGAGIFSPDAENARLAEKMSGRKNDPNNPANEEYSRENEKKRDDEIEFLKRIAENTGGKDKSKSTKPEKVNGNGSLVDTITGFLGEGFMTAFKTMFSPANILKSLSKVFAIGMIVGALFEGIMDGFKEFQKSGDIGKAIIAGLAGVIDFITFGLFDKEKIKEVIGDFATWTNDHVLKPLLDFFTTMKDSFMSALSGIGIPEITLFKNPLTQKDVTVGPFYPFKSDTGSKPEASTPTSAITVDQKSADNASAMISPSAGNNTNVVNAPQTTNNNTTQVIRSPIRNQESSQSRYLSSKYA